MLICVCVRYQIETDDQDIVPYITEMPPALSIHVSQFLPARALRLPRDIHRFDELGRKSFILGGRTPLEGHVCGLSVKTQYALRPNGWNRRLAT